MHYIPALDGIRALAILVVIVFHSGPPFLRGGFLGVDIFFVLSGFLITTLLQHEITRTGKIDIRRFYARRFKRLTPPLACALLLYLALAPHAWPAYKQHGLDVLLAATYLSDYSRALFGIPDMLRHTWSLAVEVHFYIIWPLVLLLLRSHRVKTALFVLLALYILATAWRIICLELQGWGMAYYRFDTRLSGMVLGGITALLQTWEKRIGLVSGWALTAICLVLWVVLNFVGWRAPAGLQLSVVVAELTTSALIIALMQGKRVGLFSHPAMIYLGQLSYGVYLFHYPLMLYLREKYDWYLVLIGGGAIAFMLAALSYHTVEAWFRYRKEDRIAPVATGI